MTHPPPYWEKWCDEEAALMDPDELAAWERWREAMRAHAATRPTPRQCSATTRKGAPCRGGAMLFMAEERCGVHATPAEREANRVADDAWSRAMPLWWHYRDGLR